MDFNGHNSQCFVCLEAIEGLEYISSYVPSASLK